MNQLFGQAVKARRKALGLTQAELAQALGLFQKDISGFEHDRLPAFPMLQVLAKALKANITFQPNGVVIVVGIEGAE